MADQDATREHGYHPITVQRVVQETDDARSFVLDVPSEWTDLFRYRAGQFCTFRVMLDDQEVIRCYSMSSSPDTDTDLTVTVKRVPGGLVSNWFHDRVKEGDVLDVAKPTGVFMLHEGERPVVLFAGGSGITPVASIAKTALATTGRSVKMLYANRDASSIILRNQLDALAATNADRFALRHHLDADSGYLQPEDVLAFVDGKLDADFYICGPGPYMDLVESTLLGAGVDQGRISIERFGAVPAAPADTAPPVGEVSPETVTMIVKRKKHHLSYHAGDTLLDTARRGGVQTPFSCEAGNCAACMALVRKGAARMRVNGALNPVEVAEGWVLTCQAIPTTPEFVVEFEPM